MKPKPIIKFVITHLDDFVVYCSVWERTSNTTGFSRTGKLCITRRTYETIFKHLDEKGLAYPPELKLEVTDDDIPSELKTPEERVQEKNQKLHGSINPDSTFNGDSHASTGGPPSKGDLLWLGSTEKKPKS